MRSVDAGDAAHPTVTAVLQCLAVSSVTAYRACVHSLEALTRKTQQAEHLKREKDPFLFKRTLRTSTYFMLVFGVSDDRGNRLTDYDIIFTAGPDYDENHLPRGFFVDRQRNSRSPGKLTYYLDYQVMAPWFARPELDDRFGFRIAARPDEGYAGYTVGEHRGRFSQLARYFVPNQTVMVDVVLQRRVMQGISRITQKLAPEKFSDQAAGEPIG